MRLRVPLRLPGPLQELAGGKALLELEPAVATVRGTLEALRAEHPAVYERIVTERRELRPHVNVFVGVDDIRWADGLDTPLDEESQVVVLHSVSGG